MTILCSTMYTLLTWKKLKVNHLLNGKTFWFCVSCNAKISEKKPKPISTNNRVFESQRQCLPNCIRRALRCSLEVKVLARFSKLSRTKVCQQTGMLWILFYIEIWKIHHYKHWDGTKILLILCLNARTRPYFYVDN